MTKKMFGLHKDEAGNVLAAFEFSATYDLATCIRELDIRDGDWIDFKETAQRKTAESDDVRPKVEKPPLRKADESITPTPALADEEKTI